MAKAGKWLETQNCGHELGVKMDNEFWAESEKCGDTCIRHQDQISVYINGDGDIAIRQEDTMSNEDNFIVVTRQNIKSLITAVQNVAKAG